LLIGTNTRARIVVARRSTFLESWPDELAILSIHHARVQLNVDEAKTLAWAPCLWLDRNPDRGGDQGVFLKISGMLPSR